MGGRSWRLMPAKVHPHCNGKTWESEFYFTSRTLSENENPFALHTGTPRALPMVPCNSVAKLISPIAL